MVSSTFFFAFKMHAIKYCLLALFSTSYVVAQSTDGIYNLVKRRLPNHANDFHFSLRNITESSKKYDEFIVSTTVNGKVVVEGNSLSALSSGYELLSLYLWRNMSNIS